MTYAELVASLDSDAILAKWPEVTPLSQISGTPRSSGSDTLSSDVFDGHDEEQIRLMEELCIVLDNNDRPVGSGTKKLCHLMENIDQGLLHRAFSVFLFNEDGKLLLQKRADEKITFANMWTNTCCSHPLCVPSEMGVSKKSKSDDIFKLENAIHGTKVAGQRKLDHELGIPSEDVPIENFSYLTRIHYKSPSSGKWGEHEIDYILILKAKNSITIKPNYNEVGDIRWVDQNELNEMFKDDSLVFTPWFKLICQSFLFKWWDNLDSLDQFKDDKLHRLLD
jgi:isopentenyl-diphosphate delta-isomerase